MRIPDRHSHLPAGGEAVRPGCRVCLSVRHLPAGGEAIRIKRCASRTATAISPRAARRLRADGPGRFPTRRKKTQEPPETGGSASCGRAYTCGSESFSTGASSTLRIAQRAMTICVLAEPTANTTV